jgi:hypothetical protein
VFPPGTPIMEKARPIYPEELKAYTTWLIKVLIHCKYV